MSEGRWVYGTRTNKWYLVGKDDRDWIYGIPDKEFKKMSKEEAKKRYLGVSIAGGKREQEEIIPEKKCPGKSQ